MKIEGEVLTQNYERYYQNREMKGEDVEVKTDTDIGVSITLSSQVDKNKVIQGNLSNLGFYTGQIDGNMNSSDSKNAIKNYQKTYGLTETGTMTNQTIGSLSSVYTAYKKILDSEELKSIASRSDCSYDNTQKQNFARTYVFLRYGLGLDAKQTAGVMGNINVESHFSTDNAEDKYYPGIHDKSYTYNISDGIGYGLCQWTHKDRKAGLQNMADSMGVGVKSISAQLAYLRYEVTNNKTYKSAMDEVKKTTTVEAACSTFRSKFEGPSVTNEAEREEAANAIYSAFKNI